MTRSALVTAYVNPASSAEFRDVAAHRLADGSPAVDIVCIFSANYAESTPPYLRANNNQPPTNKPLNPNIQAVLKDGSVQYLQEQGIKVLLTVGNGQDQVGWSEFQSECEAQAFASYLQTDIVSKYGLDGIDIDDEYSKGTPNNTSLIMVTTLLRCLMPDKILSKALFADQQYFEASWQGHTLAANLDYGWEMTYGGPAQDRLPPYLQFDMTEEKLSLGFWQNQASPNPKGDIAWLYSTGYAGFMVFGFEAPSNVAMAGRLVDDWYGPGNWTSQP